MNLSAPGNRLTRGNARASALAGLMLLAAALVFLTPCRSDAMEAVGVRAEQGPAAR